MGPFVHREILTSHTTQFGRIRQKIKNTGGSGTGTFYNTGCLNHPDGMILAGTAQSILHKSGGC
jgi:hypothetical protein